LKPVICPRARECVSFKIIRTDTVYHLELSDLIAQGHCLAFHGIVEMEIPNLIMQNPKKPNHFGT
jgi:hypothetical protein